MKKVLIIIHLPRASPRIAGLVRYLPEFNWEPVVLTGTTNVYRDLPAKIIETPYRNAMGIAGKLLGFDSTSDTEQQVRSRFGASTKKSIVSYLFTMGGEIINYPCPDKNWKPYALKEAKRLLREEKINALISSSPPVTGHLVARQLKADYQIPWLADLRDLWSQNPNYRYSVLRKHLDRRLELKTLGLADALTTVSEPLAEELRSLHKRKPVHAITHGFDPAEVNTLPAELTAKFTITYTGSIYPGRQDPSKLFSALRDLVSDGSIKTDDIEVRFYGGDARIDKESAQYGLEHIVKYYGTIPHSEALAKQRESQLLLLLDWDDPREKGVFTGKIFEYLGSRRPILATGGSPGNVVDLLLHETRAGVQAITIEDIKHTIKQLHREYKDSGAVIYKGEQFKIDKYSQREMSRQFAEILDKLT